MQALHDLKTTGHAGSMKMYQSALTRTPITERHSPITLKTSPTTLKTSPITLRTSRVLYCHIIISTIPDYKYYTMQH